MAETSQLADIIAPIAPPAAPPPYGWIALGVGIALIVTLILARFFLRRSRDRRAALAQLKHAEHALQHQTLDPRAATFCAAQSLRHAYRNALSEHTFPTPEWREFLSTLDQARYAPQAPTPQDAAQLLVFARHWIKRAPC